MEWIILLLIIGVIWWWAIKPSKYTIDYAKHDMSKIRYSSSWDKYCIEKNQETDLYDISVKNFNKYHHKAFTFIEDTKIIENGILKFNTLEQAENAKELLEIINSNPTKIISGKIFVKVLVKNNNNPCKNRANHSEITLQYVYKKDYERVKKSKEETLAEVFNTIGECENYVKYLKEK